MASSSDEAAYDGLVPSDAIGLVQSACDGIGAGTRLSICVRCVRVNRARHKCNIAASRPSRRALVVPSRLRRRRVMHADLGWCLETASRETIKQQAKSTSGGSERRPWTWTALHDYALPRESLVGLRLRDSLLHQCRPASNEGSSPSLFVSMSSQRLHGTDRIH